jgi:shikimate dehydrogenase
MTLKLGLIGHPVGHSRSPSMHAAALDAAQLEGRYDALDVPPDQLSAEVRRLANQGWTGANVTIPHKQAVLELCDTVDPQAQRVGAVNTLTFDKGQIHGSNTDVPGLVGSLRAVGKLDPSGINAVVFGAGGAARAAVVGLLDAGAQRVVVINRSLGNAGRLAAALRPDRGGALAAMAMNPSRMQHLRPDLVINTTPVGMSAEEGSLNRQRADLFWARVPLNAWRGALAFDLIYAPPETSFLEAAQKAGLSPLGGLDMLARQGALSFERWTGAPAATVLPAMLEALA